MKPHQFEQTSEIACNVVMTTLSLMLIAGYFCLFQLFRADRQESRATVVEQQVALPHNESLSLREME